MNSDQTFKYLVVLFLLCYAWNSCTVVFCNYHLLYTLELSLNSGLIFIFPCESLLFSYLVASSR